MTLVHNPHKVQVQTRYVTSAAPERNDSLLVEITEGGPGTDLPYTCRRFRLTPDEPFHVDCRNPDCLYGGFEIHPLILEMRKLNERESLCMESCQGVRTRGRQRTQYVRCQHLFRVHIRLD